MGIGRKQPNGKKIVELRQQKGLKQELLARDARISERLLRDIERRNKPVAATTITAIATLLGATAPEITLSMPDKTSEASGYLLKLRVVRSARCALWFERFLARRPNLGEKALTRPMWPRPVCYLASDWPIGSEHRTRGRCAHAVVRRPRN